MINTIDATRCNGCGTCFKTCGLDVFRIDTNQANLSPCTAACPAGTDIRGYNALMQQGKREEAVQRLKEKNPFPSITGRVCPHPCEKDCQRDKVDGAVNINALEQYLGDFDLPGVPEAATAKHLSRIAVAGSGPAGLSCAWFLAKEGYRVTVFEALPEPGGMLRWGIPAYRLPSAIVQAQIAQLKALGVSFECNIRVGKGGDVGLDDLKNLGYKAVCLATGASISRKANIPGENMPGVSHGLEFLRAARIDRHDAIPQLPEISAGCSVIVVGGGDVAIDAAITAKRLGAARVQLICLEDEASMPAFPHNMEDARAEGIMMLTGWGPAAVLEREGHAAGLRVCRCLSVFDGDHRFAPSFDKNDTRELEADAVIFAIGQTADLSFFDELIKAAPGRLEVDPVTFATSTWNVFAAGDAVSGPASVIKAITAGREAAISIARLLSGKHLHSDRTETRQAAENLPGEGVMPAPRNERATQAATGFAENRRGLDDIDALDESMRCMTCGALARITYRDDCMTCFFCELRCPGKAVDVHPFKERLPYTIETNVGGF